MPRFIRHLAFASLLLAAGGCGRSHRPRVPAPPLDPEAVTAAVMSKADADGDGTIETSELAAVPALRDALGELDVNHDGGLSGDELRRWLDEVKQSQLAITCLTGEVRHLKRPLANATVKLVPESFMGPDMKAAEGVTDANGRFAATIPGQEIVGVNCGLYRVEITGQGNDGKPLPDKYNTRSTLGVAVGGRLPANGMAIFALE